MTKHHTPEEPVKEGRSTADRPTNALRAKPESGAAAFTSAAELGAAIAAGALDPVAVCEATLARIEQQNRNLHAFRQVDAGRALAAAQAARALLQSGRRLGPLHGVPYATKDLFDVAGLPTTAGSAALSNHMAQSDATVTRRLAQAGLVLVGKTHTVEFAFGSVGTNHHQGTPRNPWAHLHHVPGGSSSGSAVAVAAGLVPLATGTDTACSVRTPAALCGVVGLKTTVGRISRAGVYPLSQTLDSVGPIARTVRDAALLFDALQGPDPADPSTLGVTPIDVLRTLDDGVAGLRIGMAEGLLFEDLDPEVEQAVRNSAGVFRALGASVEAAHFAEAAAVMTPPSIISLVEGYTVNQPLLDAHPELLDPFIRERLRPGGDVRASTYRAALNALGPLRAAAARHFDRFDVLLAPTTMIPAAPLTSVNADFDTAMHYAHRYRRNCLVGNLLDLCAVSVPCGLTRAGLPIGLMIYARGFREDLALRAAAAFEHATEWHGARPPHIY